MNLEERIKLPRAVISALYKDVLVSGTSPSNPAPQGIQKRVQAVVIANSDSLSIPDGQLTFLLSILKACKLEESDTAIITNKHASAAGLGALELAFETKIVILFGLNPSILALPIHFPAFQIQAFQGYHFLWAPELQDIAGDKQLKVTLWHCLQKLFNV
jgi:DNA polymerase III psi subunit